MALTALLRTRQRAVRSGAQARPARMSPGRAFSAGPSHHGSGGVAAPIARPSAADGSSRERVMKMEEGPMWKGRLAPRLAGLAVLVCVAVVALRADRVIPLVAKAIGISSGAGWT